MIKTQYLNQYFANISSKVSCKFDSTCLFAHGPKDLKNINDIRRKWNKTKWLIKEKVHNKKKTKKKKKLKI